MKMKDDTCKGCNVRKATGMFCSFETWRKRDLCPCVECLVKPICKAECKIRSDAVLDLTAKHPFKWRDDK